MMSKLFIKNMIKLFHVFGAAAFSALGMPFAIDIFRLEGGDVSEFIGFFGMSALFTIMYVVLLVKAYVGSIDKKSLVVCALVLAGIGYAFSFVAELSIHLHYSSYKTELLMHPKWYWWAIIIAPIAVGTLLLKTIHNSK